MELNPSEEIIQQKKSFSKILLKILLQFILPIIVGGVLIYIFLAPIVTAKLFPEYTVRNSYVDIKSCADASIQQESKFFQPQTCDSLKDSLSIGCVYVEPNYVAPTSGSKDQEILCPKLTPNEVVKGSPNSAQPIFKVDQQIYRLLVASVITLVLAGIYIVIRVFVRRSKRVISKP